MTEQQSHDGINQQGACLQILDNGLISVGPCSLFEPAKARNGDGTTVLLFTAIVLALTVARLWQRKKTL